MEDRKIIELYNYRSENALIETDKKYGKIVTFLICKLIKNTLDVEECRNDTANYAQTECQFRYCGTAIPFLTVRSTAR